ncbi:S-layer homology domain-containing protein [Leucobacter viscericola]|uniref:RCC1 domain-containing protein n=1 Tax=Leucobacter viscericola TaxID=2714935 RepID=UPI001FCB54D7|nr:S-layer homology domain-containing protein [Leucobacter viscericola]
MAIAQIDAGSRHVVALNSDGEGYFWGNEYQPSNAWGAGGISCNRSLEALRMPAEKTFVSVAAGNNHSLGLTSEGNAYAWGLNRGALGTGDQIDRLSPSAVLMPEGIKFASIAAGGGSHSLALSDDGDVYGWGSNSYGQLGDGSLERRLLPTRVMMPESVKFVSIAAGGDQSFALTEAGELYSWGLNDQGQLGDGTQVNRLVPTKVELPAGVKFKSLSASLSAHAVALTEEGIAYAWGANDSGQLGDGTTTDRWSPTLVAGWTPTSVLFDGEAGTIVRSEISAGIARVTVKTPAHDAGAVDITVTGERPNGEPVDPVLISGGFIYNKVPVDPGSENPDPGKPGIPPTNESCKLPRKDSVFADAPLSHKFYREIDWMECKKYSTGWRQPAGKPLYKPADSLERQAMAAFIFRMEAPKGYKAPNVSPFADVKPGDSYYKEISWMYEAKLSTGYREVSGKPTFRAHDSLSREAMAAFIYRLEAKASKSFDAPKKDSFTDVSVRQKFRTEIEWMKKSGLSTGYRDGSYRPKDALSREAMAAFIYRLETGFRKK